MKQCLSTILIVEDEPDLRELMVEASQSMGFKTYGACDGVDALEKIKTYNPFLVISDVKMPKMDGIQLFEQILKLKFSNPLVILCTGFTEHESTSLLEKGLFKLIYKPFKLSDLEEVINLARSEYKTK